MPHETAVQVEFDFDLSNHGSICILNAITHKASLWVDDHLPNDALHWGPCSIVIEPRYVGNILQGIVDDGLLVQS